MLGSTIEFNTNIETKKKLVAIARNVSAKSVSSWASGGSALITLPKEIRDTKQASILIPFLVGVEKIEDLLAQAQAGALKADLPLLGEKIVKLANELATKPIIYRPRGTEVLQADQLLERYKSGFVVSATVIKDQLFFRTIVDMGKTGIAGSGEKSSITDTTAAHAKTTLSARGEAFYDLIENDLIELFDFTDGVIQGDFDNSDAIIILHPNVEKAVKKFSQLTIKTDVAYSQFGKPSQWRVDGLWDGNHEVRSTKHLKAAKLDYIVMINGAATSLFLFLDAFNYDKVAGVNVYKMSLEFSEGTGVWFPQLIRMGAKTADHASQVAVGSGSVDLVTNTTTAVTTGKKPS